MHPGHDNIPSLELLHQGEQVSFAIRTMEEIEDGNKGVKDVPHRHHYFTVIWAKKACGKHYIDYREYDIMPNKVFFVSPGQVHQVVTKPGSSGIVIMFTRYFLEKHNISESFISNLGLFADVPDTPPLYLNQQGIEILEDITSHLLKAFISDSFYKEEKLASYIKLFLIECNQYATTPKADFPSIDYSGREIILNFKQLLEQNFKDWHKVSDYASQLHISPDYLNSVLKTVIGKTAKEYIQDRIIIEAKRLGVHTSLNSKEIAYRLGFNEPSHFSRFYKSVEGESFTSFREKLERA